MRLIGYLRVSRVAGREGASFITIDDQRSRIEAHAAAHGHTITEWLKDLDESGAKYARPKFQAALEAVEDGAADGIIVAKLDRFARSVKDAAKAIERLEAAGGSLVAVDLGMDTSTAAGRLMRNVLMALAEFELERITDNWKTVRAHTIGRGVHICNKVLAGYRKRDDKTLEPDPDTAPVVREVFRRRGDGASWTDLASYLDEKLPRPDGGAWTRQTVTTMVASRTYLGEARAGDTVNLDAHPALVTRAEWEAAQMKPLNGSRARDGGPLLAGLIHCAGCGHPMSRLSDGARGYANYKCRKRHSTGVCTDAVSISIERADSYVEREFLAWLEREPVVAEGVPTDGNLEHAVAALEAAEAELAAYVEATRVTVVGQQTFQRGLVERQRAIDEAQERVAESHGATPAAGFRDLLGSWPTLTVPERRQLLASVLDRAVVTSAAVAGKGTPVEDRVTLIWR